MSKPSWNADTRSKPLPWALGSSGADADRVAQLEEAADGLVEAVALGGEQVDAVVDVGHPCAGEAVGLELEGDGGAPHPGPELDGVGVLVGHDDADGERAEALVEVGDER